ncbi:MAG: type II secretory pathway component GspD/PulD (secretin), partial [Candidatus Paceibacteria bacterium]
NLDQREAARCGAPGGLGEVSDPSDCLGKYLKRIPSSRANKSQSKASQTNKLASMQYASTNTSQCPSALQTSICALLMLALQACQSAAVEPQSSPYPAQAITEPQEPVVRDSDYFSMQFAEEDEQRLDLAEFVKLCNQVTDINFMVTDETNTLLAAIKVTVFGKKRIHKKDFYEFFQIQMFINDFACVEVGPPHVKMVLIRPLKSKVADPSTSIRALATAVEPDELQDYANQPATLITTVLHLPYIESREISQAMRGMQVNSATESLVAAGEHSLILTGYGAYVASIARLLQTINEESAPEPNQPAPELEFAILSLEHKQAEELAQILNTLLGDAPQTQAILGQQSTSSPSPRCLAWSEANSLLIHAKPKAMEQIKALVARLDAEPSAG